MESLHFYQVECPKCHGQLNSIAPISGRCTCPFCSTAYHITANVAAQTEMPAHIISFNTLISDFEQQALAMLRNEDYAPANISEIVPFKDTKGFYLPAYLYEGKYECAWSCKVKQTPVNNDSGELQHEMYRSENGVSKGEYAFFCLAYDGVESCPELVDYICMLEYRGDAIKSFQTDDLRNCFFLPRNCNEKTTWEQCGEDSMNNIARKNTLIQLQSNDIKDFKCSISADSLRDSQFIFYPVWILNYRHDDILYHIYMDGTGRNGVKGATLIDHALKTKAEKPFLILKIIAVAAIVIPLLMLLAGWYLPACCAIAAMALVFLGYRYYARWYKRRVIQKARKKSEPESS